jgi:hypothetical protein
MNYDEIEIINRLKKCLNQFNIDFEDLSKLLIENNAFISGSFLLQVIQKHFFVEEFDIDIYTFGAKNKVLEDGIKKLMNYAALGNLYYIEDQCRLMYGGGKIYKNMEESIECIYEEHKKNKKMVLETDMYQDDKFSVHHTTFKKTLFNKYKQINNCVQNKIKLAGEYTDYDINNYTDKINRIVDFENTENYFSKHQVIYYDDTEYKKPEDIVNNFDFSFCANFFDGKKIYIKDYQSIISKSCTLNLKQHRIYKNQNNRIVKYINRGYHINAKYKEDIYDIVCYSPNNDKKLEIQCKVLTIAQNLIINCNPNKNIAITNILNNLPVNLKKIVIYSYSEETIIDNLPSLVEELRLYIWKMGEGIEVYSNDKPTEKTIPYEKIFRKKIQTAIKNIKKIPLGCKLFINDELL